MTKLLAAALSLLATLGCSTTEAPMHSNEGQRPPAGGTTTIVIGMDGFRPDYLDRGLTPNLKALADGGVRGSLQPSFPSVTLPNFYSIMTGKVPDKHGIVGNAFESEVKVAFGTKEGATHGPTNHRNPEWWNRVTPIWSTVEASGGRTAHMFFPSLGVDGAGNQPARFRRFDREPSPVDEPRELMKWLDVPIPERPTFLTLYFYPVDHEGHEHGPNSAELNAALREIDNAVGNLLAQLRARDLLETTNLVFVADHGMAVVPTSQNFVLDDLVSASTFRTVELGAYATIEPVGVSVDTLGSKLVGRHDHAECWRKEHLPARFNFGRNPRIAPIFCLADKGWTITTRADLKAHPPKGEIRGNHGYDPADPDMAAVLIGSGPAFRSGVKLPQLANTNVYFLLAQLVGVHPHPGDGSVAPFRSALSGEGTELRRSESSGADP